MPARTLTSIFRLILATAALVVVAALPACSEEMHMKPGAQSIFDVTSGPTPAEAVAMAVDKYDADRRYRGTLLLSTAYFAGEPVYVKLFETNSKDEDPGVRAASIRALGLHGTPEHVPMIAEHLKDPDIGVRVEAARALQRLHNPVAVEPLLGALDRDKEPEPEVRIEAATALGQYPESQVVENLIASLRDERLAVNTATQDSLRTLTGQDFGLDAGAWQQWYKDHQQLFTAQAAYMYPAYRRDKRWWEYLPFFPQPPNEPSAMPAGLTAADFK